jgi:hypothetical protein
MKWQVTSPGEFYDCGEDKVVYFDPASGDTHLVSDFAAFILKQMAAQSRALDSGEISDLVKGEIEPEDLPELSQLIPEILRELASLDIVAPG